MLVFLNGQLVPEEQAVVSVFDRSFLYGDGLFETIRVSRGKPFRWAQHFERLQRSALFLGLKVPYTADELRRSARELIEKNQLPDSLLRLNISRGVGPRGYSPKGADSPTVVMSVHPLPPDYTPPGWRLVTSSYRIAANDTVAQHKTTSKVFQVVAKAEAEAKGADEALILNSNGEILEASSANLFWIYRDAVYSTPTALGVLPGITRAVILEICQTMGIPTRKKILRPDALMRSEGVFVSLSSRGVIPVVELDGQSLATSPIVEKLQIAYGELLAKS